MPIDDLTALGQKMREARKKKDLTQQELADLSHVSVKQIASIEKGQINPSYLMKMLYCSCPSEMRETLLHHTQETAKELTELSEKFETN